MMPVRRQKNINFQIRTLPTGVQIRAWVIADWVHTGVIDGNKAIWKYHATPWTKRDVRELKSHFRSKSPVKKIAVAMKRTINASSNALSLGLPLGHRR
jgi:hypothetical protein